VLWASPKEILRIRPRPIAHKDILIYGKNDVNDVTVLQTSKKSLAPKVR